MDILHSVSYRLDMVPEELRDKEVCQTAYNHNFYNFRYIPHDILRQNLFLCVIAVRQHGMLLEYIPEDIKQFKPYLCMIAVKSAALALEFVPTNLKTYSLCLSALKKSLSAISFIPYEYFNPDYDSNKFIKMLSHAKIETELDGTNYTRIFDKIKSMRSFTASKKPLYHLNEDVLSLQKFGGTRKVRRTRRV